MSKAGESRPNQGTIVLVGCGAKKSGAVSALAGELYTGTLFRAAKAWAERYADDWGVLSAAYGAVPHDWMIRAYDKKLVVNDDWNRLVLVQVTNLWPLAERIILLAPEAYTRWTTRANVERPLQGMGIGQRMQWLAALAPLPPR